MSKSEFDNTLANSHFESLSITESIECYTILSYYDIRTVAIWIDPGTKRQYAICMFHSASHYSHYIDILLIVHYLFRSGVCDVQFSSLGSMFDLTQKRICFLQWVGNQFYSVFNVCIVDETSLFSVKTLLLDNIITGQHFTLLR